MQHDGSGGGGSGTPFHGDALLLEEPLLSRCNVYVRASLPLTYILGSGVLGGAAAVSGSEDVFSGLGGGAPPTPAPSESEGVRSGDPFACTVLQAYPNGLSVRSFLQQQRQPQVHDGGSARPAISTSVDTAGATVHVIADSLEVSVSVEQLRMLAAFSLGWEQPRSPVAAVVAPLAERAAPLIVASVAHAPPSLPPELTSSVPPDADSTGWLGWAFSALLTGADDEPGTGGEDVRVDAVGPGDDQASSEASEPLWQAGSLPPSGASALPLALTANVMVGAVALVLRRHVAFGAAIEAASSPGRPPSESGVTSASVDHSTLTYEGSLPTAAPVFEMLRVPVARLGIVTIAATPAGAGSGGGRSLRSGAARRLPVPFFRAQVLTPTLHVRALLEALAPTPVGQDPMKAALVDCYLDVGAAHAGHWGVDAEATHSHHVRARQLLVRAAALGDRGSQGAAWAGGAHGSTQTGHGSGSSGGAMADLSDGALCECLQDRSCVLRWGSSEEVRVAAGAEELGAHPYFSSSVFPAVDAVCAGSSAADAGVLHHLCARTRLTLWRSDEQAAPLVTGSACLASVHGVADSSLAGELVHCVRAFAPVIAAGAIDAQAASAADNSAGSPSPFELPYCARLSLRIAGASLLIPSECALPPMLFHIGLMCAVLDCHSSSMPCSTEAQWPPRASSQFPLLSDYRRFFPPDGCSCCNTGFPKQQQCRVSAQSLQCTITGRRGEAIKGAPGASILGLEVGLQCSGSGPTSIWHTEVRLDRADIALSELLVCSGLAVLARCGAAAPVVAAPQSPGAFYRLSLKGVSLIGTVRMPFESGPPVSLKMALRASQVLIEEADAGARSGARSIWAANADASQSNRPCVELHLQLPLLVRLPPSWWPALRSVALASHDYPPLQAIVASPPIVKIHVAPCLLHDVHARALVSCSSALASVVERTSSLFPSHCERQLVPLLEDSTQFNETPVPGSSAAFVSGLAPHFSVELVRFDLGDVDCEVVLQQWTLRNLVAPDRVVDVRSPDVVVTRDPQSRGPGAGLSWRISGPLAEVFGPGERPKTVLVSMSSGGTAHVQVLTSQSVAELVALLSVTVQDCAVDVSESAFETLLDVMPIALPDSVRSWLVDPILPPPGGIDGSSRWDVSANVFIEQLVGTTHSSFGDVVVRTSNVKVAAEWQGVAIKAVTASMSVIESLVDSTSSAPPAAWFSVGCEAATNTCLSLSFAAGSCDADSSNATLVITCGPIGIDLSRHLSLVATRLTPPVAGFCARITELLAPSLPSGTLSSALIIEPEIALLESTLDLTVAIGAAKVTLSDDLGLPLQLSWGSASLRSGSSLLETSVPHRRRHATLRLEISRLALVDLSAGTPVLLPVDCVLDGSISRCVDSPHDVEVSWSIESGSLRFEVLDGSVLRALTFASSDTVAAWLSLALPARTLPSQPPLRIVVARTFRVLVLSSTVCIRCGSQTAVPGTLWTYSAAVGAAALTCRVLSSASSATPSSHSISVAAASGSISIGNVSVEVAEDAIYGGGVSSGQRLAVSAHFGDASPVVALSLYSAPSSTNLGALDLFTNVTLSGGSADIDFSRLVPALDVLVASAKRVMMTTSVGSTVHSFVRAESPSPIIAHPVALAVNAAMSQVSVRASLAPGESSVAIGFQRATVTLGASMFPSPCESDYPARPAYSFSLGSKVGTLGTQCVLNAQGFNAVRLPPNPTDVFFQLSQSASVLPGGACHASTVVRIVAPRLSVAVDPVNIAAVASFTRRVADVTETPGFCSLVDAIRRLNEQARNAQLSAHTAANPTGVGFESRESIVSLSTLDARPGPVARDVRDVRALAALPLDVVRRLVGNSHDSTYDRSGSVSYSDTVDWFDADGDGLCDEGWWGSLEVALEYPVFLCGFGFSDENVSEVELPERCFQRLQRRFPGQSPLLINTPPPGVLHCVVEGCLDGNWVVAAAAELPVSVATTRMSTSAIIVTLTAAAATLASRSWRVRWREASLSVTKPVDLAQLLRTAEVDRKSRHASYAGICKALIAALAMRFSSSGGFSLGNASAACAPRRALSDLCILIAAPHVEISFASTAETPRSHLRFAAVQVAAACEIGVQFPEPKGRAVSADPLVFGNGRASLGLLAFDPLTAFGASVIDCQLVCLGATGADLISHAGHVRLVDPAVKLSPSLASSLVSGAIALANALSPSGSSADSGGNRVRESLPLIVNALESALSVRQAGVRNCPADTLPAHSRLSLSWVQPACEVSPARSPVGLQAQSPCRAIQFRPAGADPGPWSTPIALDTVAMPVSACVSGRFGLCWRSLVLRGDSAPVWIITADEMFLKLFPAARRLLFSQLSSEPHRAIPQPMPSVPLTIGILPSVSVLNFCNFSIRLRPAVACATPGTTVAAGGCVSLPLSVTSVGSALESFLWSVHPSNLDGDALVLLTPTQLGYASNAPWISGLGSIQAPTVEHRVTCGVLGSMSSSRRVIVRVTELRRKRVDARSVTNADSGPQLAFVELFPVARVTGLGLRDGNDRYFYAFDGEVQSTLQQEFCAAEDASNFSRGDGGDCFSRVLARFPFEDLSLAALQGHVRDGSQRWLPLSVRSGSGVDVCLVHVSRSDSRLEGASATDDDLAAAAGQSGLETLQIIPLLLRVCAGLVVSNALGLDVAVSLRRTTDAMGQLRRSTAASTGYAGAIERSAGAVSALIATGESAELALHLQASADGLGTLSVHLAINAVVDAASARVAGLRHVVLPIPHSQGDVTRTRVKLAVDPTTNVFVAALISASQPELGGPIIITIEAAVKLLNRSSLPLETASVLPTADATPSHARDCPQLVWDIHARRVLRSPIVAAPVFQMEGSEFTAISLRGAEALADSGSSWSAVRVFLPEETVDAAAVPPPVAAARIAASSLECVALWGGPAISASSRAVRVPIAVVTACDAFTGSGVSFPLQTCVVVAVQQERFVTTITIDADSTAPVCLSNSSPHPVALRPSIGLALPLPLQAALSGDMVEHLYPDELGNPPPITEVIARAEVKLRGRIAAAMSGPDEAAAIDADMQLVARAKALVADVIDAFGDAPRSAALPSWPTAMAHPLQYCTGTPARGARSIGTAAGLHVDAVVVLLPPATVRAAFDWLLLCDTGARRVVVAEARFASDTAVGRTHHLFWWPTTPALPACWGGDSSDASPAAAAFPHPDQVSDETCRALVVSAQQEAALVSLEGAAMRALRPHCAFGLLWKHAPPGSALSEEAWGTPIALLAALDHDAADREGHSDALLPLDFGYSLVAAPFSGRLSLDFRDRLSLRVAPVSRSVSLSVDCSSLTVALLHGGAVGVAFDASPFYMVESSTSRPSGALSEDDGAAVGCMVPWWSASAVESTASSHDVASSRSLLSSSALVLRNGLVITSGRITCRVTPRSGALERICVALEVEALRLFAHDLPAGLPQQHALDILVPLLGVRVDIAAGTLQAVDCRLPSVQACVSDASVAGAKALVEEYLAIGVPPLSVRGAPELPPSSASPPLSPASLVILDRFTISSTSWDVTLSWRLPVPPYGINVDKMPLHTVSNLRLEA